MSSDPVDVDFEYGDLREVIVGRAEPRIPDAGRALWAAEGLKVLSDPTEDGGSIRCSTHPLVRRLVGRTRG